jgi:hypothetical protein
MNRITEHLVRQFDRSWEMLTQAIEKVPDERWTDSVESIEVPYSETKGMNVWYFSDVVFHTIETVDFYTGDEPKSFKWGGRIGGTDWKTETPAMRASRITKKDMLEYISETKDRLTKKLSSFSKDELFEPDGFKDYLATRLDKFIYAMRHSMWHIGELGRAMRNWDCERISWR